MDSAISAAATRLRVNLPPDLEFNATSQYDNSSHNFGSDLRVRWSFRPNGDFFLTYNHNVDVGLPDRFLSLNWAP
jgi:hypothetical protein